MGLSPIPEIVEAIAEAKETELCELDLTLYEYVDPEAIQRLTSHGTASWTLTFEIPNHEVAVTSSGGIFVDGTKEGLCE